MKITKKQLRRIIKEVVLKENVFQRFGSKLGMETKAVNEYLGYLKKQYDLANEMNKNLESGDKDYSAKDIREMFESLHELVGKLTKAVKDEGSNKKQEVLVTRVVKRTKTLIDSLEMEHGHAVQEESS
tara:strand:- start:4817 stop:5200 length:384 start_codon:yes stop_codon:yes gene_type:complete